MRVLSLKLTIGALMAAAVVIVATLCLTITLPMSMSAIRDMGTNNAGALLRASLAGLGDHFDRPLQQALFLQRYAAAERLRWPTSPGGNRTLAELRTLILTSALLSAGKFDRFDLFFSDGSRFGTELVRSVGPNGAYKMDVAIANGSQVRLVPDRRYYDVVTAAELTNVTNPDTSTVTNAAVVGMISAPGGLADSTRGNTTNLWSEPHIVPIRGVYTTFYPALLPVFGGENPDTLGYLYISVGLTSLRRFMVEAKTTRNTEAVLYDSNLVVATTSSDVDIGNGTDFPNGYPSGQEVPAGCLLSIPFRDHLLCFPFLGDLDMPGINAVLGDREFLTATGEPEARSVTAKGSEYFVAHGVVEKPVSGQELFVLVSIPASDVTGDVVKGLKIAIGAAAATVVLAVAVTWLLIYALLAPLATVEERMLQAATLQDDAQVEERSAMAEIAALEDAYEDMNAELQRLKAFVPHSILWAGRAAPDDDEADLRGDVAGSSMLSTDSDVRAHTSRRESAAGHSKRSSRQLGRSGGSSSGAAAARLATATPVKKENVSVVALNLLGFNAAATRCSSDAVVDAVAQSVNAVLLAVSNNRGVIDSFHGDRFIATFNAVNPCAGHARRATLCALQSLEQLCRTRLNLTGTAGVACGKALVGDMGSSQMKHFCIVGPVLSQATILERLAKVYPEARGAALLSPRVAKDVQTHVAAHPVDLVWLPGSSMPSVIAVATHELRASQAHEEWLYLLQNGDSAVRSGLIAVFDELGRGRFEDASATLDQLLTVATAEDQAANAVLVDRVRDLLAMANDQQKTPKGPVARDLGVFFNASVRPVDNAHNTTITKATPVVNKEGAATEATEPAPDTPMPNAMLIEAGSILRSASLSVHTALTEADPLR